MEIQSPQELLPGKAQEKLVHPGAEGVLGTDHHQPLDKPPAFQASVDPQYGGGLAGTGDGEVGGALHGAHEKGIPHLPLPQRPGHGGVHNGLVFLKPGEQLFLPVFDLHAQPETLLQVVPPALDILRQGREDRKGGVSLGAFGFTQGDHALAVPIGQGGLAKEQAVLPLCDIAAEGELIKGAVGQGLRLAFRDTEGQGGAVVV